MSTNLQTPALTTEERRLSSGRLEEGPALATVNRDDRGQVGSLPLTGNVALLPVELDVAIPVGNFRVRDLLALERGQILASSWGHGEDVPLAARQVQLAWSEFEVVDSQLGVRVTRLA